MDKWLNYHHLIYFKTIATEGSISKASEVLKVGQPALSSQLKNFEEYLGIKLFDRINKRLVLTEAGKMTLDYANQINQLGQELLTTIEKKQTTSAHHLTVGSLDSIPKHLILDVINVAKEKLNCHFTIIEGSITELMDGLNRHEIDIILSDHTLNQSSQLRVFCNKFFTDQVNAYASKDYERLQENFPKSLDKQPVILPTDHSQLRFQIDQFSLVNDIDFEVVAQTQDTAVKKLIAIRGGGVVFLPEIAAKEYVENGQLFLIGELKDVHTEFFIISSERTIKNPALKVIIEQDFKEIT